MRINEFKISPHFSLREFECPCCHHTRLHPKLVLLLERLRSELGGAPLCINSGYRCAEHNKAVGGAWTSLHRFGLAADVAAHAAHHEAFVAAARRLGFDEVIAYRTKHFVHLGIRQAPSEHD